MIHSLPWQIALFVCLALVVRRMNPRPHRHHRFLVLGGTVLVLAACLAALWFAISTIEPNDDGMRPRLPCTPDPDGLAPPPSCFGLKPGPPGPRSEKPVPGGT